MPSFLDDLRWRGLVHQITDTQTLPRRLDEGGMVVYIGFDPTADSLHVGSLQQLVLLKRFQLAGHQPIALVGGGTGMIGDPSGKSDERSLLDEDQLLANRDAIAAQMGRFLDIGGSAGASLVDNAEWLSEAKLLEFLRDVGKLFSVNEMVRKESVRARLEGREQGLSFTEFSYMLLQAWDFLQLFERYGCELQLGGSDQWGNIIEGVDLIRRRKGSTAYGLTSPLVTKADGTKFGKTETGNVWLDPKRTSPYEFFQFWIRTIDADASDYLRRFTLLSRERIEELERELKEHPDRREAQRTLAFEVTAMVHGEEEARKAQEASAVLFTEGISRLDPDTLAAALSDAPTTPVARAGLESGLPLVDALLQSGLASSKRDARRLLADGAVYVNGVRAGEEGALGLDDVLHDRWIVMRKGKANQHVFVVEG
ncbi:MAG TPA: tyrosine--tRNA ligase [Acidimicrobiales bacterium]|nr:tyrosine--tRNA ligase [Acidimicrobiales bacterium]